MEQIWKSRNQGNRDVFIFDHFYSVIEMFARVATQKK